MMINMDWKEQLSLVYSTNPEAMKPTEEKIPTPPPSSQNLRVALDKRNRRGKQVTIVADFKGEIEDLEYLCRALKKRLGVGGSAKDGEIIIQGDFRTQIATILQEMGYKCRVI